MLLTVMINCILVCSVVLVHYEVLSFLTGVVARIRMNNRIKIVLCIFGALCAHAFEIWIFAFAYYGLIHLDAFGALNGAFSHTLLDCAYFSFTTFSSLGFGDIVPTGHLRFVVGLEVLTGLVLLSWTASFIYLEMQKLWSSREL